MKIMQTIERIAILNRGSKGKIANFILQHSRDLSKYTVDEIADETFTSKASVVRFAQKLNFRGWRQFIDTFVKEQSYLIQNPSEIDANFPFKKHDSSAKVIQNMYKLHRQAIALTVQQLEQSNLEKAAEIILKSKSVVFYAESPNVYLTELFKRKLLSIGIRAKVLRDDETGLETGTMTKKDCAVIVSYSGNEKSRAVRHINLLKVNHVPVIGVTSDTPNYLRKKADINLLIVTEENLYTKISSFETEISIEFILNAIFALIFHKNYDANQAYHLDSARYLELQRKNKDLNK